MDTDKYRRLPDNMPAEELNVYWREALDQAESVNFAQSEEMSIALCELAQRQWNTYEILEADIKARIESWVFKFWNPYSKTLVRNVISIVGYIGLVNSHLFLKTSLMGRLPEDARQMIQEAINQWRDNVGDPYSGSAPATSPIDWVDLIK